MSDTRERTAPYGTWSSPISAEMAASAGIEFGHMALDGGTLYWREQRPAEEGRSVIVRHTDDSNEDVTPPGVEAHALVNYAGGDFTVHEGIVFFTNLEDQRVYRQPSDGEPVAITPEPETDQGLRYADFEVTADGRYLYCVREDHDTVAGDDGPDEPKTTLVRIPAAGSESPTVVASGHDFYSDPRLSPTGDRLAWLTWDHPGMPWDGTELHVADVRDDGGLTNERVVMGGPDESVFQPAWRADGALHAVSDRTGWWNLYRREDGEWVVYREEDAEYGVPAWKFGFATYGFLDDGRIAVVVSREGEQSLELLGPDGTRESADLPYTAFSDTYGWRRLRSDGTSVYVVATNPATPAELVRWSPGEDPVVLRRSSDVDLDAAYVATPDHVTFPTRDGAEAYMLVYPPTNPDIEPPADERPPLVVYAHGGPEAARYPAFDLVTQFFTSRGFVVADVNYRGSTGYGRAYREALYGEWGTHDVEDCIDAARHLAAEGQVDGDRLAIRGGSAGGFIVLSALAFHDAFDAGASRAGVADLERLAETTYKFESTHLDKLVGPYPEMKDTYEALSPVHHADEVDAPLLILQGEDDPVVPLSQAETMVESLAARGTPHYLRVFENEGHTFDRAESRQRYYETELAFFGDVFGFEPADDLPALDLSTDRSA